MLAGADTELRDQDGRTPLHLSIIVPLSQPCVPGYLLEVGAAGSATDAFGMTPLDLAVRRGRADAVRAVFRETGGAPGPCPANAGLLYEAVRGGDAGIVAALVGAGWEAGVPPARRTAESSPSSPPSSLSPSPSPASSSTQEKTAARGGGRVGPGTAAPPAAPGASICSAEETPPAGCSAAEGSPTALAAATAAAAAAAGGGETLSPLMLAADR